MVGGFEAVVGVGLLLVAARTVEEEEVEEALEAAEEGREEVGAEDGRGLRDAEGVDMGREEEEERGLDEGPATDGEGSGWEDDDEPFLGAPPTRLVEDEEVGNLD